MRKSWQGFQVAVNLTVSSFSLGIINALKNALDVICSSMYSEGCRGISWESVCRTGSPLIALWTLKIHTPLSTLTALSMASKLCLRNFGIIGLVFPCQLSYPFSGRLEQDHWTIGEHPPKNAIMV